MRKRTKNTIFTFLLLGCGIYSADYLVTRYKVHRSEIIMSEYSSLDCEHMKAKFEADLKQDQLKYFSFGMFYSEELTGNLRKLEIENFHQGCTLSSLACYNELVENYLLVNENIKIKDLY